MKENNKYNCRTCFGIFPRLGFTLIELLVVVLIIGILAAIALPQYQKAVLKSRYGSLVPLAKAIRDGNEAYYLINGNYSNDVSKLDVTTNDPNAEVILGNEEAHKYVRVTRADINNRITMYQKHSVNFPDETHCEAIIDNTQANWLCRDALKGTLIGNKYGYTVYSLNEDTVGTLNRVYSNLRVTTDTTLSDGDVCIDTVGYRCNGQGRKLTFENGAKCISDGPYYGCDGAYFANEGVCFALSNSKSSCQGRFDHSYCVGNSPWNGGACRGRFSNYSICYANAANNTCTGTYDETSCCYGSNCTQNKCEDNPYWVGREIPNMPTYP